MAFLHSFIGPLSNGILNVAVIPPFKEVLDDLLSNGDKKLNVVKEQMKHYGFSNDIYEIFEKRFTNYRDIVMQEVF